MRRQIEEDDYPFPLEIDTAELLDDLENIFDNLVWAPGQIVWEDPTSIYEGVKSGRMNEALLERLETLESELLIESAYFVPRESGVGAVRSLTERGIRVRVLTNSLVANDVLAAHAGYSKYRKPLLKSGAELYELRPYPGPVDQKIVSAKSDRLARQIDGAEGHLVRPEGRVHRQLQSRSALVVDQYGSRPVRGEPGARAPGDRLHGRRRFPAQRVPRIAG